jgi:hypothetical protein
MLQSETVAALLLPTDFRAEPKIDCVLALVLLPTIRRGKADSSASREDRFA